MATIYTLLSACQAEAEETGTHAQKRIALWNNWLTPVAPESPAGEDPGYDDDFQQMREEVNKLSGANTSLVCELAEKLLVTTAKDIRIATYYAWARLHRDGENGLADGLELIAGLLQRFGTQLHPQRDRSRKAALEWLCSSRMLDSLSLYPEVVKADTLRVAGALWLIEQLMAEEVSRPALNGLYQALESRLMKSGGVDAVVPQNVADTPLPAGGYSAPVVSGISSGQDLLTQARVLAKYLRDRPNGWLSGHHLMKSIRHDTLHTLPPLSTDGRTRIEPPKPDQRALLKRLYLQQSWLELLEHSDDMFTRGANHLWLDLQWYIHQALLRSGQDALAAIIQNDLCGLLARLPGLETLAFNDGTPFADEVTTHWIRQQVMDIPESWQEDDFITPVTAVAGNEILLLEPEALKVADSEGAEAALCWLQARPGITTVRQKWLLRLVMSRVAEQCGKKELATYLLNALGREANNITLIRWEPELLFEVLARHLKLVRSNAGRNEADKLRQEPLMERLLAELITLDPARAAVLCS
ncbi:type VI secretion system protein TssA [Enterobacter sp. Bisph1]|uniref:type VI secretion system protein TssA n=1 Tax=Enterobacter sp. Bisph1 TaxID=1274399 RepID=UPI00057BDC6C|nr:type VI secretion system protein TssA [Enterobacter sp. Bisph1]